MTRKEWRGLTSIGVILLIFCASFVIGIGAAAASPSVSIDPVTTSGLNQGDVFHVTVEVNSDTHDLRSLNMNLYYDSSALQVNSITEDGLLGTGTSILAPTTNGDDGAGTISYGISSTAGPYSPKSGTFVTIEFQIKATAAAGTYNLNLDNVMLVDENITEIPGVVVTDGTATVVGVATTSNPTVEVNPVTTSGLNQGDVFHVTVDVDSDTHDLRSLNMNLYYDSSALQVNSITEDGLLGTGTSILAPTTNGDDGAGTISYGISSTAGPYSPKSGTFVTIEFQIKATAAAGTYNLNLDNVMLVDENITEIPGVVVTDGTATVVGVATTSNPTVEVNPVTTSGLNQGDVFHVTVDVDSDTHDLRSLNMNLYYDSSALQVNSITEDGLLGTGTSILAPTTNGDDGAGTISYGISSTAGPYSPKSGTFVTIEFQIKATAAAGTYNLNLDNVMLVDETIAEIPGVVVTDGTATVVGAASTSNPTVKVNPMASSGEPGDIFQIMVDVDSDTHDLRSLNMNLYYDSSALQVNSITENGLLGTSILELTTNGDDGAGTISYGIARIAGPYSPESGTFISIVFQIKDTAAVGTYNLNLDDVILVDETITEIAGVVVTDGTATVGAVTPVASAVRTLPESVERGEQFTVSMEVSDYGTTGLVVETIPKSFTYVNSTLDTPNVIVANDTVTFNLEGETNFEYIVTASSIEGTYAFSGVLIDESANEVVVGGDTSIDVVLPDGIILQSGWNFISVPHELSDLGADNVLTGITDDAVLTCYNAETRLWETVTTIEPMKGYWIYIPEDTLNTQVILEEVLDPVVPVGPVSPPSIQLYEGWNTIGYTDSAATLPAELTLAAIDDCYTSIWGPWNPVTMSYEYFGHNGQTGVIEDRHVGTDIFEMSPYNGYWVFVTQDCVLNSIGG